MKDDNGAGVGLGRIRGGRGMGDMEGKGGKLEY